MSRSFLEGRSGNEMIFVKSNSSVKKLGAGRVAELSKTLTDFPVFNEIVGFPIWQKH